METSKAVEEVLSHAPIGFDTDVREFATEKVLLSSRYLFVERKGRVYHGYCTYCRQEREYDNVRKHNAKVICQGCHSLCIVKQSGRGRKYLFDEGYFVYFSKSEIDPKAIVARGIYVCRDYSGDYKEVETMYDPTALYLFKEGASRMITKSHWWQGDVWRERKSVYPEATGTMVNKPCYLSVDSVKSAVEGTRFQYSAWEQYQSYELIQFFDLAAKYPCVEYLTKIGMKEAVSRKIHGGRTYSAINWRGKTLMEVLKVDKQDLFQMKNADFVVDLETLRFYQIAKNDGVKMNIKEVAEFVAVTSAGQSFDIIRWLMRYGKINEIRNYIKRQSKITEGGEGNPSARRYTSGSRVLIAWRDYLTDCNELGMDTKDKSIIFPSDLYRAHQETIRRIKVRADEELNKKIAVRSKKLRKYTFENGGIFIRPAESTEELIEEGNALKHCVAGYAERYAKARTDLFVIRKTAQPNEPYYTLEVRGGRITQVYGYENKNPDEKVQSFVDAFEKEKINTEKEGVAV